MNDNEFYLDYNATTPLANEVKLVIIEALEKAWGNPSSCYESGLFAKKYIVQARQQVANMLSCTPEELIFTSGGTESNNWVIQSAVTHFSNCLLEFKEFGASDGSASANIPHIITSNIEHDSIRLPLLKLAQAGLAEVTFVEVNMTTGAVNVDDILNEIKANTCLITVMLANNETGVIQPIAELGKVIVVLNEERRGATKQCLPSILLHTDAAQAIGKIDVNVEKLKVHYLTVVGHKFYGPRIGALYSKNLMTKLHPFLFGGGQEFGLRPGTENTAMIAGLGKACELVTKNLHQYNLHFKNIRDYLENKLQNLYGEAVHFNCKNKLSERLPNTSNFSICLPSIKNGCDLLSRLDGVYASLGAACHSNETDKPSKILLNSGVERDVAIRAIRFSIGRETSIQNIDDVIAKINQSISNLDDIEK